MWGESERVNFHQAAKNKGAVGDGPGPPLTAVLNGGWGVREWKCVCVWVGRDARLCSSGK